MGNLLRSLILVQKVQPTFKHTNLPSSIELDESFMHVGSVSEKPFVGQCRFRQEGTFREFREPVVHMKGTCMDQWP